MGLELQILVVNMAGESDFAFYSHNSIKKVNDISYLPRASSYCSGVITT